MPSPGAPLSHHKIHRWGQKSPPLSPGWTGCRSGNAAQEVWREPRASALVLPGMKSPLCLGAQSEALPDHRGSVCLLTQRRSPQLGPRARPWGALSAPHLTLISASLLTQSSYSPPWSPPTHRYPFLLLSLLHGPPLLQEATRYQPLSLFNYHLVPRLGLLLPPWTVAWDAPISPTLHGTPRKPGEGLFLKSWVYPFTTTLTYALSSPPDSCPSRSSL